MRLRFSRPPLPIMILLAAIFGAVFYYFENVTPEIDIISPEPTAIVALATTVASDVVPIAEPTIETRFIESRRQELPQDTAIFIPTAGIWSDVIQAYFDNGNWDIRNLRSNAGHLEGTPWVNQPGNVVISGHVELSSGLPGIFSNLEVVEIGQVITVMSEGVEHNYIVSEIYNTVPDDLSPIEPTQADRLTLITCNSYDIMSNSYRERLIIVAERVS